MLQQTQTSIPAYFDQRSIKVAAYSFSGCNEPARPFTSGNVFLDILLQHPKTAETITLRTIVPAHLLCSSKADVEVAVHRELRNIFHFQTTGIVYL